MRLRRTGNGPPILAELNAIPKALQNRPEVLQLRLHHLMLRKSWHRAFTLSRKLCRVAPECGAGFLHGGFCLNQLGRTEEARGLLLTGPPSSSPRTDLLLQYGLLRSAARQPAKRGVISKSVFTWTPTFARSRRKIRTSKPSRRCYRILESDLHRSRERLRTLLQEICENGSANLWKKHLRLRTLVACPTTLSWSSIDIAFGGKGVGRARGQGSLRPVHHRG